MKKYIRGIIALYILTILLLVGCSKIVPGPKEILSKYLEASLLHDRYEEAYQYISAKDKTIKSLREYLSEHANGEILFAQDYVSKISYEIKEVKITANRAKANVAVTAPDFESMVTATDIWGLAFTSAFGGEKGEKEMEKMLAEKLKEKNIPMATTDQSFDLVKEADGWKVFLDWETEMKEAEKKRKVKTLLSEAEQLKKQKKLKGALRKYKEVLELDSEEVSAKEGKVETEKEVLDFEEKQSYINNVKLYDFTARYIESFLDGKVPGVKFKIKNTGDKTLTKVEVTVYFKDSSGNVIAEENFFPVLVSDFSFTDAKPLKPNYIWQLESGKFYSAKSVPSEWQEGNAVAKITDIEFEN